MNVKNVATNENGKLTFTVEVDSATFEEAVNKAYQKAKKDINVPGFRKGKAPRMVIEGMYGKEVFYDDAVNLVAPPAYEEAKKQEMPRTVGDPAISNVEVTDDKTVILDFEIALYPEVTLGQYKGLEVYRESTNVSQEDIAAELEKIRVRNARIESVDRAIVSGDTANIDFDGYKDGVRFDGGMAEGYNLEIGSNSFVPGFEEQLIGMKAGDEKDIDITFPENYAPELAGAAVVFKVKINEVKQSIYPTLDDEFAKDVSEFDTLAEYEQSIKEELGKQKEESSEKNFRNLAISKAAENMTVEIPDAMIEEQVGMTINDYAQNCAMQGMKLDDYLASMGMNEKSFRQIIRPSAQKDVQANILLEKIAEVEGIVIADDEIEEEYKRMSELYSVEIDKMREAAPAELLARDLKVKRAVSIICDSAVATDKPEEKKEDPEKKPADKKTAAKKAEDEAGTAEKKPAAKKAAAKKAEGGAETENVPADKKTTKAKTEKAE